MSFSGRTDGPDEATQHDFLDAERRWNADEKGDFRLLAIFSDAEQRLMAGFFEGWIANMRLKHLAYLQGS
jgi:hypothetical protein